MELKVEKADYIFIDKFPMLRLIVNGKEALIGDFKAAILNLGYVPLASNDPEVNWSQLLQPVVLPKTEEHRELTLEGFTSDPVIIHMAKEYWKAINWVDGRKFKEGPVPIPNLHLIDS